MESRVSFSLSENLRILAEAYLDYLDQRGAQVSSEPEEGPIGGFLDPECKEPVSVNHSLKRLLERFRVQWTDNPQCACLLERSATRKSRLRNHISHCVSGDAGNFETFWLRV